MMPTWLQAPPCSHSHWTNYTCCISSLLACMHASTKPPTFSRNSTWAISHRHQVCSSGTQLIPSQLTHLYHISAVDYNSAQYLGVLCLYWKCQQNLVHTICTISRYLIKMENSACIQVFSECVCVGKFVWAGPPVDRDWWLQLWTSSPTSILLQLTLGEGAVVSVCTHIPEDQWPARVGELSILVSRKDEGGSTPLPAILIHT